MVLGGLAIIIVAAVLITKVFGGGDSPQVKPSTVGSSSTATGDAKQGSGAGNLDRTGTKVAVLNGTTVGGLARAAADKIAAAGYTDIGPVQTDTSNQARAQTAVFFSTGARREALDVARAIGLGAAALAPMDQNVRVLGAGAPVVVIVGANQAQ
ncbi:unannotated protein [freshwater metagenome]|uniref:Unannotated protein n=1 Tax=freshwater metagenome TaxID=449393 RepID=A0A6J7EPE4_9ZZZZ